MSIKGATLVCCFFISEADKDNPPQKEDPPVPPPDLNQLLYPPGGYTGLLTPNNLAMYLNQQHINSGRHIAPTLPTAGVAAAAFPGFNPSVYGIVPPQPPLSAVT